VNAILGTPLAQDSTLTGKRGCIVGYCAAAERCSLVNTIAKFSRVIEVPSLATPLPHSWTKPEDVTNNRIQPAAYRSKWRSQPSGVFASTNQCLGARHQICTQRYVCLVGQGWLEYYGRAFVIKSLPKTLESRSFSERLGHVQCRRHIA
jgi:hypothetical protein